MMVFTHVLIGLLIGALASTGVAEIGMLAIYAGIVGGGFPDLDMFFVHRRTFHYPAVFSILTVLTILPFLVYPAPILGAVAVFLAAAAVHCLMDVLGGGKELRPWREVDDRAVFNHLTDTWIRPRRLVYDGSISDLFLGVLASALSAYLLWPRFRVFIAISLLFAVVYAVLRRWIARQISDEFRTFSAYIKHRVNELRIRRS